MKDIKMSDFFELPMNLGYPIFTLGNDKKKSIQRIYLRSYSNKRLRRQSRAHTAANIMRQ